MTLFKNYVSSKIITLASIGIGAAGLGLLLIASVVQVTLQASNAPTVGPDAVARTNVEAAYGKLPLRFEANQGQTDKQVKFLARGSGYSLYLTPSEAVLRLRRNEDAKSAATLRMKMAGAKMKPQVAGVDLLAGVSNYYIGNDQRKWHTGIPSYSKVKYEQIYPGIDMVYYGTAQGQLEYDFIVSAGADPKLSKWLSRAQTNSKLTAKAISRSTSQAINWNCAGQFFIKRRLESERRLPATTC